MTNQVHNISASFTQSATYELTCLGSKRSYIWQTGPALKKDIKNMYDIQKTTLHNEHMHCTFYEIDTNV
jgi:hypothetical protein